MSSSNIKNFFEAKSVAIIGVSNDLNKIGSVLLQNLINAGFNGDIYPINPKYDKIQDLKCYNSIGELSGKHIDVVCISIPSIYVDGVIEEIVGHGDISSVVIISAGFGEISSEGHELEQNIALKLANADIELLGPNCLGYMNISANINLTFAAEYPSSGDIAVFSQSGAICTALLDMAKAEKLGFSHFVSIGNKAGFTENKLLNYFLQDPKVNVIGAYLENFVAGRDLINIYNNSEIKKPFVVLKPGRTKQAARAIQSHTGAVVSAEKTMEVTLEQNGIIKVDSVVDLYKTIKSFSWLPEFTGKNTIIVTNAGGPGILATDEVVLSDLTLYDIPKNIKSRLLSFLPKESSVKNPIDLLGDALEDRYSGVFEILEEDPDLDIVLVLVSPQFVTDIAKITKEIVRYSKSSTKVVVPIFLGEEVVMEGVDLCEDDEVPAFRNIQNAVKQLDIVSDYYILRDSINITPTLWPKNNTLGEIDFSKKGVLNTDTTERLLENYGISVLNQHLALSLEDALAWAKVNYPVVLKVPNDILVHKTEAKGVMLNINSDYALKNAWKTLSNLSDFLLLQKQINYEQELFIGAHADSSDGTGFGKLLLFGQGGIYAEILEDFGYVSVPGSRQAILKQLAKTKIGRILVGARNKKPLAVGKFVELLERVQMILMENPEIESLDLNPVLITEGNVYAVDVKVYV